MSEMSHTKRSLRITLKFHARPVVWYSMTYLRNASMIAMYPLAHSTCLTSLRESVRYKFK